MARDVINGHLTSANGVVSFMTQGKATNGAVASDSDVMGEGLGGGQG